MLVFTKNVYNNQSYILHKYYGSLRNEFYFWLNVLKIKSIKHKLFLSNLQYNYCITHISVLIPKQYKENTPYLSNNLLLIAEAQTNENKQSSTTCP